MSPEPNWLRLGVSSLSQPYVIVDICTKNTLIQYTTHCIWVLHMQIHLARIYKLMWSIIKPVLRGQVHSRLQQMCALEWSRPSPTSLRNTRLYHKKTETEMLHLVTSCGDDTSSGDNNHHGPLIAIVCRFMLLASGWCRTSDMFALSLCWHWHWPHRRWENCDVQTKPQTHTQYEYI